MPLGKKGKYQAQIDADDQERLSQNNWSKHPLGYAYRQVRVDGKKKTIYMHREVLKLKEGEGIVDHIDGNRLNNSKTNLRWVSSRKEGRALNAQNRRSTPGSSSQFRGVSKRNNRWTASAKHNGKSYHLGTFSCEYEAGRVAQEKRKELHPWAEEDPRLKA